MFQWQRDMNQVVYSRVRTSPKKAKFKAFATKNNDMKRHEPLWMVVQELDNQQLEANLRVAIYDEGEEDKLLEYCPEEAAKSRDLSPMHSGKKVNQRIALKQLPVRAAKQKGVVPSTSTRSNR